MSEKPKLTDQLIVGVVRFQAGVTIEAAQGAIDRLYARYVEAEKEITRLRLDLADAVKVTLVTS